MPEAAHILAHLKLTLKARRITYRQLGKSIGMTESGVKKLFSGGDCSLGRALGICDAIGVAFEDLVSASAARQRKPARLTAAQEDFFLANPQCFYYLLELVERSCDPSAVAAAHEIEAHAERAYLAALASQGCLRVLPSGTVRIADPFRSGIAVEGRVAQVILHAQQTALLEAARRARKSYDDGDRDSIASLGMGTMRLRRDTLVELKQMIRERGQELERRARREAVTTPPDQLVDVGLMTVLAPFKWADVISLQRPNIKRAVRSRRSTRRRKSQT